MIGLMQRVTRASVHVEDDMIANIGPGLLVLVGVLPEDDAGKAERLLDRLLSYRVFEDGDGRMNLNLQEVGGEMLLVPQFTLAADTRKGKRPGFSTAADPVLGRQLFDHLCTVAARRGYPERGRFGADMQVSLVNDGPVTLWLEA